MYVIINKNELKQEETALIKAFRELRPEARHIVLAQAQATLRMEEGTDNLEHPEQAAIKQRGSSAV
jgi:hypothetical protein